MTDFHPHDDQLLARLLQAVASRTEPPSESEHVDDESMALFVDGALNGSERDELLLHLDVCPDCRQAAAWLLSDRLPVIHPRSWTIPPRSRSFRVVLSVAALVIVTVTLFPLRPQMGTNRIAARKTYDSAAELLAQSDFDQVETMLATAKRRGTWSPALSSLEAQAIRRMPAPLALSESGRLTDFGYDVGGVAPRALPDDPEGRLKSAQSALADAGEEDIRVLLNRGHLLLSLRKVDAARREFAAAVKRDPSNALAWLGLGLANFMRDDFTGAEEAFQRCLRIDTHQVAAKINLAMTLEEAGQSQRALDVWKALQSVKLSAVDRAKVEQAIQLIEGRDQ